MARKKSPHAKPPATRKLTTAELAAALRGETTLPANKIEQAIAGVQVDSAAVEQTLKRRIEPDGTVSGSPTALRVFDAVNARTLEPARFAAGDAAESKAVGEPTRKRSWTVGAASQYVKAHLKKHPRATLREISVATGIPHGTIGNTPEWRIEAARRRRRKEHRQGRKAGRTAISLEKVERMMAQTSNAEVDAVIEKCVANPELREAIASQCDDMAADKAQRRAGRRSSV